MRRRVRFLRKARELAYRDLGGLVFNLHRFGQRNDALVLAKLSALSDVDAELRGMESALKEHRSVTVLHEAGVSACPRCAAIHSGEDRFCPNCGLPMSRHVDLPIGGAPASPTGSAPAAGAAPADPGTPAGTTGPSAASGAPPGAAARTTAPPPPVPTPPERPTPAPPPAASTPVRAPATGRTPSPSAPPERPSAGPPAEPPPPPAAAPAPPAEDQPTKIIRPPAKNP
jgi:hypothetical protein